MVFDKIIIIFSGYNNRAIISFIRTLEKYRIRYAIIARSKKDPIFKTSYKNHVEIIRESQILDLESMQSYINLIQGNHGVKQCFIAPSTETLNRFLQEERAALEQMDVIVPLSDASIYTSVSDKKSFSELCKGQGILIPYEYNSIADTKFPFVAKPRKYFTRNGSIYTPFLIFNKEQKKEFIGNCDPEDFYFQEYVEGDSKYLLYYFHRNGEIFKFSQENLVQQPGGQSMVAAVTADIHKTEETLLYEHLFKEIGFFGLVMVELKASRDGNYMIEANPRFWGPSQLFVDAGMNFFEALLHDYGFVDNVPCFDMPKKTKYFWFGGVHSILRDGGKLSFHKGDERGLLMHLDEWIQYDVLKRLDTIEIFKEGMR